MSAQEVGRGNRPDMRLSPVITTGSASPKPYHLMTMLQPFRCFGFSIFRFFLRRVYPALALGARVSPTELDPGDRSLLIVGIVVGGVA